MYKYVHLISALVRQYLLPNPYIHFFDNEVYADIFNLIVGGMILWKLSYWLTGVGYQKGIDNPASGSIGYLISYSYLTGLITLLGYLIKNIIIFIIVFITFYLLSVIAVGKIFGSKDKYNF